MFEYGWFRVIVVSLLFAAYGTTNLMSRLAAWKHRPVRVRRPLWSHLLGFLSVIALYALLGSDGHSWRDGQVNGIGVTLCILAAVLRFAGRRGRGPVRYPDLAARVLFYASLPIVAGSPRSWIFFTLPQVVIALVEARQRDAAGPRPDSGVDTPRHRVVPGVW
jgi:hypothetical protein